MDATRIAEIKAAVEVLNRCTEVMAGHTFMEALGVARTALPELVEQKRQDDATIDGFQKRNIDLLAQHQQDHDEIDRLNDANQELQDGFHEHSSKQAAEIERLGERVRELTDERDEIKKYWDECGVGLRETAQLSCERYAEIARLNDEVRRLEGVLQAAVNGQQYCKHSSPPCDECNDPA